VCVCVRVRVCACVRMRVVCVCVRVTGVWAFDLLQTQPLSCGSEGYVWEVTRSMKSTAPDRAIVPEGLSHTDIHTHACVHTHSHTLTYTHTHTHTHMPSVRARTHALRRAFDSVAKSDPFLEAV